MERTPINPDEATQRDQVRRFLNLLIAATAAVGVVQAAVAFATGSPRSWATAILLGALVAWLAAFPRRIIGREHVELVITRVAVVLIAVVVGTVFLQPRFALVAATALLVPVAATLPYLEVRSLRRLMALAWASAAVTEFVRLLGLAVVIGLVFFLLWGIRAPTTAPEQGRLIWLRRPHPHMGQAQPLRTVPQLQSPASRGKRAADAHPVLCA